MRYTVWTWYGATGEPLVTRWFDRAAAVTIASHHVRQGATAAVVIGPDGRLVDSASAGEEVSLDEMLGRGRHGTGTAGA